MLKTENAILINILNFKFNKKSVGFLEEFVWSTYTEKQQEVLSTLRLMISDLLMNPTLSASYTVDSEADATEIFWFNEFLNVRIHSVTDDVKAGQIDKMNFKSLKEFLPALEEYSKLNRGKKHMGVPCESITHKLHDFIITMGDKFEGICEVYENSALSFKLFLKEDPTLFIIIGLAPAKDM